MALADQLRHLVNNSGMNLHRLSQESGVPYAMLYRFAHGQRSITLPTAEKLAEYFGVRLTMPATFATNP